MNFTKIPDFLKYDRKRGSRLSGRERNIAYEFLVIRDGEKCAGCQESPPFIKLDVEHKDGNKFRHYHENLQLMCRSCNSKKNPRGKSKKGVDLVSLSLAISRCKPAPEDTKLFLKKKYLPEFLNYLETEFMDNKQLVYEKAITAGALRSGFASKKTIREYLELLSCDDKQAPLIKYKDNRTRVYYIRLKHPVTRDELSKLFQRYREKYCS